MALPDLTQFCVQLFPGNRLCVVLPGGTEICAVFADGKIPDGSEITNALLGQVNAALAPLTPIFDIIDFCVAIVNCFKAIEQALGPPPDPSKLAHCFPELARKLAALLKLLPQLSIPVLIGGLLDVLIANLIGLRTQFLTVIRKQLRVIAAQTKAGKLGSVALHTQMDCATGDIAATLVNMNENSKNIGRLINVINPLLELAGLPQIPSVQALGTDAQAVLAPINDVILLLQGIRKGFP